MKTGTIYTIGHSNRTLDEFFVILHQAGIRQLVDIRSHPASQRFPSFDRNTLSLASEDENIAYAWFGHELGGFRREQPDSPHCALASAGLKGYADHMAGPRFKDGISRLISLGNRHPVALMCAERDPASCHRRLIADYLTLHGWQVMHLLSSDTRCSHVLHPLARVVDQQPIYDRLDEEQLKLGL